MNDTVREAGINRLVATFRNHYTFSWAFSRPFCVEYFQLYLRLYDGCPEHFLTSKQRFTWMLLCIVFSTAAAEIFTCGVTLRLFLFLLRTYFNVYVLQYYVKLDSSIVRTLVVDRKLIRVTSFVVVNYFYSSTVVTKLWRKGITHFVNKFTYFPKHSKVSCYVLNV